MKRTVKAWSILNAQGALCETLTRDTKEKAQDACAMLIGRSWVGLHGLGCRAVRVTITYTAAKPRARDGRKGAR